MSLKTRRQESRRNGRIRLTSAHICLFNSVSVSFSLCLSLSLSLSLSVCLPVCLSVCLPACLPACLSVCLSVCLTLSLSPLFPVLTFPGLFVCLKTTKKEKTNKRTNENYSNGFSSRQYFERPPLPSTHTHTQNWDIIMLMLRNIPGVVLWYRFGTVSFLIIIQDRTYIVTAGIFFRTADEVLLVRFGDV